MEEAALRHPRRRPHRRRRRRRITVSYAPDALVIWDDGIRAYAASKGIVEDMATATNTPEGKAYVRNMLASRVKGDVERQMAGQLNGTRPVRLDVVVRSFTIASAVQRIVIGGGHGMTADANLVDARNGAVILSHPNLAIGVGAAGGLVGTAVRRRSRRRRRSTTPTQLPTNGAPPIATGCCAGPDAAKAWADNLSAAPAAAASPLLSGPALCLKRPGSAATPVRTGV
jgi:hypothetical protein